MSIFDAVKQISCNDAAQRLGLKGRRTSDGRGMWVCPFHEDKNPSLTCYDKDNRFYCFGCHASGDAANLYARVLGLSQTEAARQALAEFGIRDWGRAAPAAKRPEPVPDAGEQLLRAVCREWRRTLVMFTQAELDAAVAVLSKCADPEDWAWTRALTRACTCQDALNRLLALEDDELLEDVHDELLREKPDVEPIPRPGRAEFLALMDDLRRRGGEEVDFSRVTPEVERAVLEKLCYAVPKARQEYLAQREAEASAGDAGCAA